MTVVTNEFVTTIQKETGELSLCSPVAIQPFLLRLDSQTVLVGAYPFPAE